MSEKNFIIGMSNNEISRKYMEIVIPQIKRVTFEDVNLWEGTTPETLPNGPLNFHKTKPTKGTPFSKELSLTEKSVWYSHYRLWKHIHEDNLSSWIFEHDIDLSKINVLINKTNKKLITARDIGCLDCYYITHEAAELLIYYSEKEKINLQVDGFVGYLIEDKKELNKISCKQQMKVRQLKIYGNTIDHQPSFAT